MGHEGIHYFFVFFAQKDAQAVKKKKNGTTGILGGKLHLRRKPT